MLMAKFAHVFGAVLMLGNVIATGLWAHFALARPNMRVAPFATRVIVWADLWLTLVGGTLLTMSGLWMAREYGLSWAGTPWLRHGVYALAASTLMWLAVLMPDQFRMVRLADRGDVAGLRRVYRRWAVLGWVATGALVWGLWVMVMKV
jgi:uncharacterized membrane protein